GADAGRGEGRAPCYRPGIGTHPRWEPGLRLMTPEERQALRERYGFRCGYCGVRETEAGAELTVDHFQPRSQGGTDEADNLVYCCHACNEFKADHWRPDSPRRLLHPQRDELSVHLSPADDGTWVGLTETGVFHIRRLRLNRPALVAQRRERRLLEMDRAAYRAALERLAELEQQLTRLQRQLESPEGMSPDEEP